MSLRPMALSGVYRLLEPGPVVMITTAQGARRNVMTLSWQTMIDFEPPLVGVVISNRDFTFGLIEATRECVIAVPTVELSRLVVAVGNTSGRDIDKFTRFGIETARASRVRAPLLRHCHANFECKVIDVTLAEKYNLFILEVIKAWRNPAIRRPRTLHHMGRGLFMVAGEQIKLPSRMK